MDFSVTPAQRALPLVDAIYEAAVEARQWNAFLEALSEELGGAAIAMSLAFPGTSTSPEYYRTRLDPSFVPVFERHLARGLPWGPLTDSIFREGFGRASRNFPDAKLPETEYYRDYMQPQGLAPEGPIAHLIHAGDGRPVAGISIARRIGDRPIDDSDVAMCNLLIPHLSQSYNIRRQLRGTLRDQGIRAEVLDRIPTGIALVDSERRVVEMNRAAADLLAQSDGIHLDNGLLRVADRRDDVALGELIAESAREADPDGGSSGYLTIARPSQRLAYGVLVSPLLAADPDSEVGDRVTSVIINDPTRVGPGQGWFDTTFRETYGLTQAESELVHLLVKGNSLEQISSLRDVSIHTTRSQLKRVFGKTETSRQSDLMRLALIKVASVRSD